jgi:uncharacterized protein
MTKIKFIIIAIFVALIAPLILWINRNPILNLTPFKNPHYNKILNYQLTTLILAGIVILGVSLLTNGRALSLLNLRKVDGPITPEPWIGINPKQGESWKGLGINFSVIITLVTTVVIFFQVFKQGTLAVDVFPGLLLVVLFALSNAFVEEILFRFTFVGVGLDQGTKVLVIQAMSALIFGIVHYFGNPSGIPGVLMAGFIGWFLSKSMIETGGFFWAWFIHFLQDVVILFALLMT